TSLLLLLLLSPGLRGTPDCSFPHSPISSTFTSTIGKLPLPSCLRFVQANISHLLQDTSQQLVALKPWITRRNFSRCLELQCQPDSSTLLPPRSPGALGATSLPAPQAPLLLLLLLLLLPVALLLLATAWCLHWRRKRQRMPYPGERDGGNASTQQQPRPHPPPSVQSPCPQEIVYKSSFSTSSGQACLWMGQ
ncbi:hypothetical protein E2I00_012649, partial [Balaenoptera physalus]